VKLQESLNLKSVADPCIVTGIISTKPWTGDMTDTDYVMAGDAVELHAWKN
jgi:hypothetical protein